MEENLDKNNKVNKEISDNTTKSNSDEIKVPKSEKVINMDINNVSFSNLRKFDGKKTRRLNLSEIYQIAGRAGRHTNLSLIQI